MSNNERESFKKCIIMVDEFNKLQTSTESFKCEPRLSLLVEPDEEGKISYSLKYNGYIHFTTHSAARMYTLTSGILEIARDFEQSFYMKQYRVEKGR